MSAVALRNTLQKYYTRDHLDLEEFRVKRFYKNIWFWLTVVFFALFAFLVVAVVGFNSENNSLQAENQSLQTKNESLVKKNKKLDKNYKSLKDAVAIAFGDDSTSDDSDSSDESSVNSNAKYKVNEEAALGSSGEKQLSLTLASATKSFNEHGQSLLTSDLDLAISNEKSVQVTFKYTNVAYDESWLPSIFDFTVYDKDGNAGEIVNQQDGQDEVAKGRSSQTTFWVNFDSATPSGSAIEIDYQGENLETPITFAATVQ